MKNTPITVILPNPSPAQPNVVGLQTISADLPAAWDYWDIDMIIANLNGAVIQEVRLLVNQTPVVRIVGADLDVINQYDKATAFATNGILKVFMRRLGIRGGASIFGSMGKDKQGNEIPYVQNGASAKDLSVETSLNCGSVDANGISINSLRLEVDLVGTAGTAPTFLLRALATDPVPGGAGTIRRLEKITVPVVIGQNVLNARSLMFGDSRRMLLNRLILIPPAGTLDNFLVRFNNKEVLQRSAAENTQVQTDDALRAPQAGYYMLDWTERGFGDEDLLIGPVGTDLQVQFDATNAGNLIIYEDTIGAL